MSRYLIDQLATRASITVMFGAEIAAVHGDASLQAIEVRDTRDRRDDQARFGRTVRLHRGRRRHGMVAPRDRGRPQRLRAHGPRRARRSAWELDRDPYLLETSVPGIFACGDVRFSPVKRVAAAVGEGSMVIAFVHQYLKDADSVSAGDFVQVGTPAPERRRDQRDDGRGTEDD